ncbi:MAG: diguanylate cyclase [Betaproteobacteria bacterium]
MTAPHWWQRLRGRPAPHDAQPVAAAVDELTGLPTRMAAHALLTAALARGDDGVVVMVDLDHFKLFNDRHGHRAGDDLLRAVARRLREKLAAPPHLARYGGDEFVAFLPGIAIDEGMRRVQACVAAFHEPVALEAVSEIVTFSAGIATLAGASVDEAWRACDLALYAAKARGRDRVVAFDDDTRRIVTERRALASTVVELQERNRALREEARTDALTGLRNRLALDELLDQGGTDRRLQNAAVAFVDIDHFGDYNHVHGDTAGDDALQAVARAIRASARAADHVFRKGGEEFVVVLPDTAADAASAAAERIRAAVQALALAHAASPIAAVVTVTIGVASAAPGRTLRQLLSAAAEQAMAAKVNDQRNRVHAVRLGTSEPPAATGQPR